MGIFKLDTVAVPPTDRVWVVAVPLTVRVDAVAVPVTDRVGVVAELLTVNVGVVVVPLTVRLSIVAPPLTARAWFPAPAEPVEFTVKLVLPVAPADKPIVVPVALVTLVEVAETELTIPDDTKLRRLPLTVIPPVPVLVKSIPPFVPVERTR